MNLPVAQGLAIDAVVERRDAVALRRWSSGGPQAWLAGIALPLAVLALYEAAFRAGLVEARLLPPPSRVLAAFRELAVGGELARHVAATVQRVAAGFLAGAAAGTLLGIATSTSTALQRYLDPTIQALRAIPSLAWVPLFILWFGIFEGSKITLIAVGVFFPVYLGVLGSAGNVDRKIVEVGRVFRLPRVALAWRILLPAILPEYRTALRSGLGLGFMFVVAAEVMGASEGLGYLLVDGQQLGKPSQIIVAIVAFAVIGKLADLALVAAFRPALGWNDSFDHEGDREGEAAPPC